MSKIENPGRISALRVQKVVATAKPLDSLNPTHNHPEVQSELLAVASVMRRFRVSFWHAKTICRLYGLGGQHA
jgi:hypothetical protein